jgi:acyl-CoA synthetase (AMP-forming)/AMP-acid ligase II
VVAVIGFSSGTTGKTKGVELSHYNINATVYLARITTPERANSSNVEVWFPPCKFCPLFARNQLPGVLTEYFEQTATFTGCTW